MSDILLPELGEGIDSVEIRDVLVKKGDLIKKNQTILILETDKASMEIPSEYDGVVSVIDFKTSNSEKKEEWIENYFIQGTAYAKMFTERTGIPCSQLVIFIMPDSGVPQIFTKPVDDYTPLLKTAIQNFNDYKNKRLDI